MEKRLVWIVVAIGVIVLYHLCYGLGTLVPGNIRWLMEARHDWGTHYLGWAFYKNEPWHFPLGQVNGYNYPVGTNVGFTDSIPLMAIFFKLFAPWLPEDFQYFGIWLFSCHALVALFAIRILTRFRVHAVIVVAGSLLIAFNPELIHRGIHPALCAQWLLVAPICFYFTDPRITAPKIILRNQFVMLMLSALINPYLCLMVVGFTFALPLKLWLYDKLIGPRQVLYFLGVAVVSVALVWLVTGMIVLGRKEDLGVGGAYGLYTLNLNSLYNSSGFSALTPIRKWVSWHQYEGFMYLGAGIMLLLLILLLSFLAGRVVKKIRPATSITAANKSYDSLTPLVVLMGLFTLMAVSLTISFNDKIILRIPAPAIFVHLEEVFRACGRFFWPAYYLFLFLAVIGVARLRWPRWIPVGIIVAAMAIQFYDIKLLIFQRKLSYGTYTPPMHNALWEKLMAPFSEVLFFPAFSSPKIRPMDYQDFSYLALKAHKPVNLAYVARGDSHKSREFSDSLNVAVEDGHLSPGALYITDANNLSHFSVALTSHTARLGILDSCFFIYVQQDRPAAFTALVDGIDAPVRAGIDSAMKGLSSGLAFTEVPEHAGGEPKSIRFWLESFHFGEKVMSMSGFAFIDTTNNNKGDSVFVTFTSPGKSYLAPVTMIARPDLSPHYKKPYLDDAGFNFMAYSEQLAPGAYTIGLAVKDAAGRMIYQPALERGGTPLPVYRKK